MTAPTPTHLRPTVTACEIMAEAGATPDQQVAALERVAREIMRANRPERNRDALNDRG